MTQARDYLEALYLDRFNNYLTDTLFAEHNGMTEAQALELLAIAKSVYESQHPEA